LTNAVKEWIIQLVDSYNIELNTPDVVPSTAWFEAEHETALATGVVTGLDCIESDSLRSFVRRTFDARRSAAAAAADAAEPDEDIPDID
jgi:hypothetical protein